MAVGGATWGTAGTLELGSGNTFDSNDATGEDDVFPGVDEAFWTYTPAFHQEVRITLADNDHYGHLLFQGDSFPERQLVAAEPGYPVYVYYYWLLAGVEYHLVAGNLSGVYEAVYQITLGEITPLATTPWYSDLRDRTDNVVDYNTRTSVSGLLTHRSRSTTYGITREIDSPAMDTIECAWQHAHFGSADVITWEGFCPPRLTGNVPSAAPVAGPYADADFDTTHGGNAQDILFGAAIHMHQVYDDLDPLGVLPAPEPVDNGLTLPEWRVEYEQPKPDLRLVEFAGGDIPPLDPLELPPYEIGITYRDEHVVPPEFKVVPTAYDVTTGQYDEWPKSNMGVDYTLGATEPDWVTLAYEPDWTDFFFPAEGEVYARGDWVFGATMIHGDPDGGPEIERPSFTLRARFSLQASRYRFIYKRTVRPFPPRRGWPRHQATTAARGAGGRDDIQSGPRGSIGGVT